MHTPTLRKQGAGYMRWCVCVAHHTNGPTSCVLTRVSGKLVQAELPLPRPAISLHRQQSIRPQAGQPRALQEPAWCQVFSQTLRCAAIQSCCESTGFASLWVSHSDGGAGPLLLAVQMCTTDTSRCFPSQWRGTVNKRKPPRQQHC